MPAFPIHTLFAHLAGEALAASGHPWSAAVRQEPFLFLQAGTIGGDIQLMPYCVCRACGDPTRVPVTGRCPVCRTGTYAPFAVDLPGMGPTSRVTIETVHFRRTHLVLGECHGWGVPPDQPVGPADQPFPLGVIERLANVWGTLLHAPGSPAQQQQRLAYLAGWFAHVVSDALFKGVYPHCCRINFYGVHYGPVMHPAAEALAYFLAEEEHGVDLAAWWERIPQPLDDGGALAVITDWGDSARTALAVLRPVNVQYLVRMYAHPGYAIAASPGQDPYDKADYRRQRFGPYGETVDQVYHAARENGFLAAFSTGVAVYQRLVAAAGERLAAAGAR